MFNIRRGIKTLSSVVLAGLLLLAGAACQQGVQAVTSPAPVTMTVTVPATQAATAPATTTPKASTAPAATTTPATSLWPIEITGQLTVSPKHATIGSSVTVQGSGYRPNASFQLMWQDMTGSWSVKDGEYYGRNFKENWLNLATIQTDASGGFNVKFNVPDGFGFTHDLVVLDNGVVRNKLGYFVDMEVSLSPPSGPLGTPITVEIKGMGWRDYENAWHLQYDNQNTGIITTTTTHGYAKAVIPATGAVGKHVLRVIEGAFTVGYLNHEECPFPDTPTFNMEFNLTPGDPVLPPAYAGQSLTVIPGKAPAASTQPYIWADPYSAPVGTPIIVRGGNMAPNAQVTLFWYGVSGNRVSGGGWEQIQRTLGTAQTDANGAFEFKGTVPDTHGAGHRLEAQVNGYTAAETTFNISPSIVSMDPSTGPVGTVAHLVMKGVSWTATANNYYMVYDNSFVGYACGFNSNGTINVYLPVTGTPGWHYVDFYPGIYKGTEAGKIEQFRIPFLQPQDHPGESLPVLRFAFYVTA